MDVLSAIRKRVGGDGFIVGFRYTADEAQKGGITPADGIEISRRLAATGQLDFLNVIRGRIHTDPAMTDVIPVQGMASAPHLDFAGEVKKATGMRPSTPPGFPTWPPRAMRWPRGGFWTWSA